MMANADHENVSILTSFLNVINCRQNLQDTCKQCGDINQFKLQNPEPQSASSRNRGSIYSAAELH